MTLHPTQDITQDMAQELKTQRSSPIPGGKSRSFTISKKVHVSSCNEEIDISDCNDIDNLPWKSCYNNPDWKSLLTSQEIEKLYLFKQKIYNECNENYITDKYPDQHLIQFILAQHRSIDDAYNLYIGQLRMYHQLKIDSVAYSTICAELDKRYYNLAGCDKSGRPIVILEQNKVDGNIDYVVRIKTAMLVCEAIYDLNPEFMRIGISLFCDLSNISWNNISLKFQRFLYSGLQDGTQFLSGEVYLYNKPMLLKLAFKISKGFIREKYRNYGEKILNDRFAVDEWFCNKDQLSPKYGGEIEYDLTKIVKNYIQKRYLTTER